MTRRDYVRIAQAINSARYDARDNADTCRTLHVLASRICKDEADLNPRFDEVRFMKACGFATVLPSSADILA